MLLLTYGFCLWSSCDAENGSTAFANANIKRKRRKSMNGKRVRMAVMSAVILSALAVSGCSAEGNKLLFRFFIGFNKKIDFPY